MIDRSKEVLRTDSAMAHEVLVDVGGCAPDLLCDVTRMRLLAEEVVATLGVTVLQTPQLHRFPDTAAGLGGVTALYLLSESHLALHTWPERAALLLSVCCCRPVVEDAQLIALLQRHLGPVRARLRRVERAAP